MRARTPGSCFYALCMPYRKARSGGLGSRLSSCDTGPGLPPLLASSCPCGKEGDPGLRRGKLDGQGLTLGGRPPLTFTAVSATAGALERTGPA